MCTLVYARWTGAHIGIIPDIAKGNSLAPNGRTASCNHKPGDLRCGVMEFSTTTFLSRTLILAVVLREPCTMLQSWGPS